MRCWVGWSPIDALAAEVCASSLRRLGCEVAFLRRDELVRAGLHKRELFRTHTGQLFDVQTRKPQSTEFAFTRFHVPELAGWNGWALYTDPDTLWLESPESALKELRLHPNDVVACVQHKHEPTERSKMGGLEQTRYPRKNWSSVMLFNAARCEPYLKADCVNAASGLDLHGMRWAPDSAIAALDPRWNWLALPGSAKPTDVPTCVHWTLGGPWMAEYTNTPFADLWRAECADFWWEGRGA